ncbi:MAG: hypothetical protein AAGJ46_14455 [Planctomycetota bacterium]
MPLSIFRIAQLTNAATGAVDAQKSYDFADMIGTIATVSKTSDVIVRRGVDGIGLRDTGNRAEPFSLVTVSHHASLADADGAMGLLKALQLSGPGVRIIKHDVDRYPVHVLSVDYDQDPVWIGRIASARYPTSGPLVELRSRWRMLSYTQPSP